MEGSFQSPTNLKSPEERKAALAAAVADAIRSHNRTRIESQTDYQAVIVRGRRPNHVLHLILSLLTLGLWAFFVWLPITLFGGEKRSVISVDDYGNVLAPRGSSASTGSSGRSHNAFPARLGRIPTWGRWAIGAFAVLVVISAASTGSNDSSEDRADPAPSSQQARESSDTNDDGPSRESEKPEDCGTKATDDCTPHVGSDESVRVDALLWRVTSARTAKTLGDQQYGLGAEANGQFLIVNLKVESDRSESATLTSDVAKLEVDGKTFEADLDGSTAALTADEDPFFLESIGPESTTTGTVVFDVPEKFLNSKLEMRFGELGFGSTKGYIRLPRLRPS